MLNTFIFEKRSSLTPVFSLFRGFLSTVCSEASSFLPYFNTLSENQLDKKEGYSSSYLKFCRSVWRHHFSKLSREELCSLSFASFWKEKTSQEEINIWNEELFFAWKRVLKKFPIFVIYFPGGSRFSQVSLEAFSRALLSLEEQDWSDGIGSQTTLFLGDQEVGDEGAKVIASQMNRFKALVHLDLSKNFIGEKGVSALAEMLKENESLKVLDLSGNHISEEGVFALIEALHHNRTLKSLSLSTECITIPVAKAFEKLMAENPVLENLDIWR